MPRFRNIRLIAAVAAVSAGLVAAAPASAPHAARRTLVVTIIDCETIGHGRVMCEAYVSGGTGPYTYTWNPTPLSLGGQYAVIGCPVNTYRTIGVTVTDANSATSSYSGRFFCGNNAV